MRHRKHAFHYKGEKATKESRYLRKTLSKGENILRLNIVSLRTISAKFLVLIDFYRC
ncbi:hypothetical protein QWZ13_11455 [Reinekea marina]|uniref:hypothetical protein n=1 Tax=Reinekea marina TaxID=1310421 RepID=UPI0025B4A99C|nr:hypothetical protein [Reinekea marina]MDN3649531.1 hypothetical protein [Reinekea marina]